MSDRPTEGLPEDPPDAASENGGTFVALVDRLEAGSLSAEEQRRLADLLVAGPPELVMAATRHESYSGPLPHPDLLNRFDEPTRRAIVQMAVDEQMRAPSAGARPGRRFRKRPPRPTLRSDHCGCGLGCGGCDGALQYGCGWHYWDTRPVRYGGAVRCAADSGASPAFG